MRWNKAEDNVPHNKITKQRVEHDTTEQNISITLQAVIAVGHIRKFINRTIHQTLAKHKKEHYNTRYFRLQGD